MIDNIQYMQEEALKAIIHEREYQNNKWGSTSSQGLHSNLEFLAYIRDYVEEAMHVCSRNADASARDFTQDSLRKIAALAVAAMEQNGVRYR